MREWVCVFGVTLLQVVCGQYAPLPARPPPPTFELPTEVGWFEGSHGFPNAQQAPEVDPSETIPLASPSVTVKDEVYVTALLQGRPKKELLLIALTMYTSCTECFLGYISVSGEPGQLYMLDVEESFSHLEESALMAVVSRLGVLCQLCFEDVIENPDTYVKLPSEALHSSSLPIAVANPDSNNKNNNEEVYDRRKLSNTERPAKKNKTVMDHNNNNSNKKSTNSPKALPIPFAEAIPKIPIVNSPLSAAAALSSSSSSGSSGSSSNSNSASGSSSGNSISSSVSSGSGETRGVPSVPPIPRSTKPDEVTKNWKEEVYDWTPLPSTWELPIPEINPKILPRPSGELLATPIHFGEFDRLGYIRFRKAASTSLQNHLLMRGGVEFCTQKCDYQSCLYAPSCNVTMTCEREDMQLDGYPCAHMGLDMVVTNFKVEKDRWLQFYHDDENKQREVQEGRIFYLTILRDPTKRVISEFFYAKYANVTQDWKGMYPEKIRPSILAGDLKQFVEFGDMNVANNRMTLQMIKRDYPEPMFFKTVPPHATPEEIQQIREDHMRSRRTMISSALHYLRQCRVVLIAEYLSQSLMLLRHVLGKDSVSYHRPLIIRKSPKDQARLETEKDPEVLAAVKKATWADQILYEDAKEMFFSAFKAMLESKGEVVTDIHESLAKYHIPGYGVKTLRKSEFPGMTYDDEEEAKETFAAADGNYYILVPQPMGS